MKIGLDELMKENKMDHLRFDYNVVSFEDGEFCIRGRQLREKMVPNTKIPIRKKTENKSNFVE